jgi:MFS superfamily sulfate permease-like transporter
MWKSQKLDFVPYTITFVLGLFVSVEVGLIAGTITHLCILLYKASRPNVLIKEGKIDNVDYRLVTPDRGLFFPSVDYIREEI